MAVCMDESQKTSFTLCRFRSLDSLFSIDLSINRSDIGISIHAGQIVGQRFRSVLSSSTCPWCPQRTIAKSATATAAAAAAATTTTSSKANMAPLLEELQQLARLPLAKPPRLF